MRASQLNKSEEQPSTQQPTPAVKLPLPPTSKEPFALLASKALISPDKFLKFKLMESNVDERKLTLEQIRSDKQLENFTILDVKVVGNFLMIIKMDKLED